MTIGVEISNLVMAVTITLKVYEFSLKMSVSIEVSTLIMKIFQIKNDSLCHF